MKQSGASNLASPGRYVKLQLPVFHIGFFSETLSICRKICKDCGKVFRQSRSLFLHH